MLKKYCKLKDKVVYKKICLDCGKLKEIEGKLEKTVLDCEHLFLKVTFVGSSTSRRYGRGSPVGSLTKYQYPA